MCPKETAVLKKMGRDRKAAVVVSLLCKIVGPKFVTLKKCTLTRAVCCEFCETADSEIIIEF